MRSKEWTLMRAALNRLTRVALSEVGFELAHQYLRESHAEIRERRPGRGNSKSKSPDIGKGLTCSGNKKGDQCGWTLGRKG